MLAAGPAAAWGQGLVVRDGTLGSGNLGVGPGTDPLGGSATYLITPEMGEQSGSNLFHSFARFGIGTGETATFTGPDPIDGLQNLHDHHVVFRSVGGDDDLANRTTLCAYHHLRGVHAGRVRVIGSAPAGLRFELGLRPGQPPLLCYRSGDRVSASAA